MPADHADNRAMNGANPPPLPPPLPRPVVELAYASPLSEKRPGLLTGIGVLSIVLGALGILMWALNAVWAGFIWFWALVGPAMAAAGAANWSTPTFAAGELQGIVQGFELAVAIPDEREPMLAAFLNERGLNVFPGAPRPLTTQAIQPHVQNGTASDDGTIRLDLTSGILDIGAESIVWVPGGAGVPWSLSPAQVEAIVQGIGRIANTAPTPPQYAAIRQTLAAPQRLVNPNPRPMESQIAGAIVSPGGALTIYISNGGSLYIPAPTPAPIAPATAPTTGPAPPPAPAPAPAAPPPPFPAINRTAAAIAMFGSLAGVALAIFLLVIGILLFRQSQRARRLHLIYSVAQVVVALVVAAAWTATFAGTLGLGALWRSNLARPMLRNFPVWTVGLGLAYPLALLIVMNLPAVKAYYARTGGTSR